MFYTLSFLYFWWNGTICFSFFQKTRLPSVSEEECSPWVSHGLDPLQDLFCSYPLSGPVSPWSSLPSCPVVAGLRNVHFQSAELLQLQLDCLHLFIKAAYVHVFSFNSIKNLSPPPKKKKKKKKRRKKERRKRR